MVRSSAGGESGGWVEDEADATVAPTLVLHLDDPEGSRTPGVVEMGASARLSVDAVDLDDPQPAIGRWRRRHREAADETGRRRRLPRVDVGRPHRHPLPDHLVDSRLQPFELVPRD